MPISAGLLVFGYEVLRLIVSLYEGNLSIFLPSSIKVLRGIFLSMLQLAFWHEIAGTVVRIIISFTVTLILALVAGVLLGLNKAVYNIIRPAWDFLRSIPPSVLFPLFVLIIGIGDQSKIATTAITSILILGLAVAEATNNMDAARWSFYRDIGVGLRQRILYLALPEVLISSWPAMKVVVSITVALMIICEMFLGSSEGLGGLVIDASRNYKMDRMMGLIIVAGILGLIFNTLVEVVESKFVHLTSDRK